MARFRPLLTTTLTLLVSAASGRSATEPPVTAYTFEAGRMELHAEGSPRGPHVTAEELRLRAPSGRLEARTVRGPLPDGPFVGEGLSWSGAQGRLDAEGGRLRHGRLELTDLSASRCRCARPPWRLTASSADVTLGQGAWLRWPVLWAGGVPVATAPRWYLPLARRQSGLLLPTLGWDGEEGLYGTAPVFLTLGPSADVTLRPGWRGALGPSLGAEARWVTTAEDSLVARYTHLPAEGLEITGEGTARLGPMTLAVEGALPSDRALYDTLHPGVRRRRRDHLVGTTGVSLGRGALSVGVRASHLTDLRRPGEALFDAEAVLQPRPEIWSRWTLDQRPLLMSIDGRLAQLRRRSGETLDRADLQINGEAPVWLGPLHLRPGFGALTAHTGTAEGGSGHRAAGHLSLEAAVGASRRFTSGTHVVRLVASGRVADEALSNTAGVLPVEVVEPWRRGQTSRRAGLTLDQRWHARGWRLSLALSQFREEAAPVEGWEPLRVDASADGLWLGLRGVTAGPDAVVASSRLGPTDGVHLTGGYARFTAGGGNPWLRDLGIQVPIRYITDADVPGTGHGELVLPLDSWRLSYGAVVTTAAEDGLVLAGQRGGVAHMGRCQCWSARLDVNHERGRDAPDVWVSVALH